MDGRDREVHRVLHNGAVMTVLIVVLGVDFVSKDLPALVG